MARRDKRKGRSIECFIDDRCRIFYAPRSKLIKLNVNPPVNDVRSRDSKMELRPLKNNEESSVAVDSERRNNDNDCTGILIYLCLLKNLLVFVVYLLFFVDRNVICIFSFNVILVSY